MRIAVLTSSRADFGIYLPLIKKIQEDDNLRLNIIAFGTHLSAFHGKTVNDIRLQGFEVSYSIESMLLTDSSESISTAIGLTTIKFASFWEINKNQFDLVFCLGDRYEMYAAVIAGIPFQIPFAHIHGGETTLGAIDNFFRHSITLASKYHFVATKHFADKVAQLTGSNTNVYHVGALSLDNLSSIQMLTIEEFNVKWGVNLSKKTILVTFHPETIALDNNQQYIDEIISAVNELTDYQILITMPNADTAGSLIRNALIDNFKNNRRVFLIENLGSQSYFTAMNYCSLLLGNTSSGIIEAASFKKYVINLGNRQKGRLAGDNVIHAPIDKEKIIKAVKFIETKGDYLFDNIYYKEGATNQIIKIIKNFTN